MILSMTCKRMRGCVRLASAVGLLILGWSVLPAQTPLTVEQAIDLALENNGTVRSALENRVSARARLEASRASLFPNIDLSTSSTTTRIEQGGLTSETTQRQSAFSLDWLLLDNGQRDLRLRQASRSADLASQSARETVRRVIFSTARAYYEVLRREELLQVADAQVERARTLLEVAKAQAEVGTAPAKDVLQAEADLANALVQQIQARNALRLAQSELKRLIGWEQTRPLPELVKIEAPESLPPVEDLEKLWARARTQRPELRNAELSAQVSRLGVDIARNNSLLQVQVSVRGFREFDPNTRTQGSIQVLASYPLFDGGLTRANLRQAEAEFRSAQFQLIQAERDAYAEVESAFLNYTESEERLSASRVALAAAQRNFEAARDSFQEGVGTIVEVLTAQLALVTAQTNFVQAVYDSAIAQLQLKLAVGDPLPRE